MREYGVQFVWLADEHFAADRDASRAALECLAERDLAVSLNLNMTAASVVENADLLPLYKRAGVSNIVMGIESLEDATVEKVRKNNPYDVSKAAIDLLAEHGIVSLVNIIFGLEDETWGSVLRTFRRMLELDADIFNACYVTPLHWTKLGRQTRPEQIIQPDLTRWDVP